MAVVEIGLITALLQPKYLRGCQLDAGGRSLQAHMLTYTNRYNPLLTAMNSMPARCAPRGDLATRRCIEQVVFEVRTEIAQIAQRKADEAGEPPLSEQG
jgi:hypothetical protein